jgi:hypothetical protein
MGNYVSFTISGMIRIQANNVMVYSLCGVDQAMPKLDCFSFEPANTIETLAPGETCLIHFATFRGKGGKWRIMFKCEDQHNGDHLMAIPEIRASLKRRLEMLAGSQQTELNWLECHIFGFMTTTQTKTKALGMAIQVEPFGMEAYNVSEIVHPMPVQAIGPRDQGVFIFMIRIRHGKKSPIVLAALNGETFGGKLENLLYLSPVLEQLIVKFE